MSCSSSETHRFIKKCILYEYSYHRLTVSSASPDGRPPVAADNRPAGLSRPSDPLGEQRGRGREGALMEAVGNVYMTPRREPGRQILAEDVKELLSAVSAQCQLSISCPLPPSLHFFKLKSDLSVTPDTDCFRPQELN